MYLSNNVTLIAAVTGTINCETHTQNVDVSTSKLSTFLLPEVSPLLRFSVITTCLLWPQTVTLSIRYLPKLVFQCMIANSFAQDYTQSRYLEKLKAARTDVCREMGTRKHSRST